MNTPPPIHMAVKAEPADVTTKGETKLKAAVTAAKKVSDMSRTAPDADTLSAEHARAVTVMKALLELFPVEGRPAPNAPPPGRGPGGH